MHFAGYVTPDHPAPPSIDDWAALMPVPLVGLVPQASVEERAGSNMSSESNGRVHDRAIRISYTLWRVPEDRDDPRNLAELPEGLRLALDAPPQVELPEWMTESRRLARFPLLWDSVSTVWRSAEAYEERRAHPPTLEQELVQHVNYILMNKHPEPGDRGPDGIPRDEAWHRVHESHVEHGIDVEVNGRVVSGIRIDTDPCVYAVGVDLGDRMLTAVFDRDDLPYLRIAFADRPSRGD